MSQLKESMNFGVFVVVLDEKSRILMVKHNYGQKKWSLPGGKLEKGELVTVGAARETVEETGFEVDIGNLVGIFSQRKSLGIAIVFEGNIKVDATIRNRDYNEIAKAEFISYEDICEMGDEIYPAQLGLIEKYCEWLNDKLLIYDWMIPIS